MDLGDDLEYELRWKTYSEASSVSLEQENKHLFDSSQVAATSVEVQAISSHSASTFTCREGDILPLASTTCEFTHIRTAVKTIGLLLPGGSV